MNMAQQRRLPVSMRLDCPPVRRRYNWPAPPPVPAADAARPGKARGQNLLFGEYICIYEKNLDLAKKVLARPGELTAPPRGPVDGTRATMSFSKKFQKKFPHFHLNFFSHGAVSCVVSAGARSTASHAASTLSRYGAREVGTQRLKM